MTVLPLPPRPPADCPGFGRPPWLGAFIRLRMHGLSPDVAEALAVAGYDVVGVAVVEDVA